MQSLVSEDDLERARTDAIFRHQLLAKQLDQLLEALNRMRRTSKPTPEATRQIREGVDLALEVAERLHRAGIRPPQTA